ncbi:hypothetical protein EDC56_2086 [Sinobacterium caligoides]|uniref:Uncharacterized protein n=1 Tax=Sinobacterium caligoides TaxID=933926 RepID=A0A3N2DPL1_9GAMM|nr:hypothetical protein [Sinobacterium caligoides]ROS01642.1 hypothetical protein EDC56_2086 [Sinobacterium caligoides]
MNAQTIQHSFRQHRLWLSVVATIKCLQSLCYDIRTHRGASTAHLVGDDFLNSIAFRENHNVEKKLKQIQRFSDQQPDIIQRGEYLAIHREWQQLQQHWTALTPLDCFGAHCKLLMRVNKLSWKAIIRSDHEILANSTGERSRLCHYVFNQHIPLIESAATLRGMACYSSAKEAIDTTDRARIGDLCTDLFEHWNQQQHGLIDLPSHCRQQIEEQASRSAMSQHLLSFIDVIKPIQNPDEELPNSAEIFIGAADFLSQLKKQYDLLANQLASNMPSELASWVNGENVVVSEQESAHNRCHRAAPNLSMITA